jgi:Protein of unknown function (DUF1659)
MNFEARSLILVFNKAVDETGKPKLVRKTFKHVGEDVENSILLTVGHALAGLYAFELNKVCVDEDYSLSEPVIVE